MRPRTDLVIFDCDGVLVDSEAIALEILVETLAEAGLPIEVDLAAARFLGRSTASVRAIIAAEDGVTLPDAALDAMRDRLFSAYRGGLRAAPGVFETLAALPCDYCVASSSLPERIEVSLRAAGLWTAFAGRVFSAAEVAHGKPAPDLFLHAAARMGRRPNACLVVEDSAPGIRAAQAAGMRVIAFGGASHAQGARHRAAVAALRPDATIDDLREVIDLIH